jgi:hypothetical protein
MVGIIKLTPNENPLGMTLYRLSSNASINATYNAIPTGFWMN